MFSLCPKQARAAQAAKMKAFLYQQLKQGKCPIQGQVYCVK